MGMDEGEFRKMRLGVFFLKLHFFVKDRKDRFNTLSALLRLHAFQVINANRSKPLSDPKLLWKIEGENELSNTYVVPKEEMTEEFMKKIDELLQ